MSFNRRHFLNGTLAAVAAWAARPLRGLTSRSLPNNNDGTPGPAARIPQTAQLGLQRSVFEPLVGSAFAVSSVSGNSLTLMLTLLSVGELPAVALDNVGIMAVPPKRPVMASGTTGFLLSFAGPSSQPLTQDTYRFEHQGSGWFDLFIVPSGVGNYTAVIVQPAITVVSILPKPVPFATEKSFD